MDEPPKVLLVEGLDDRHVVRRLQERTSSAPSFDIQDKEGIDNLLRFIEPEIRVPGRAAVGIVARRIGRPVDEALKAFRM